MTKETTREALRTATLGKATAFRSKEIEYNGLKFEIRQPSIGQRAAMRDRCVDEKDKFDRFLFLVWSVIGNTYVAGTDIKVYEDTDFDALMATETGGFVDKFSEIVEELLYVDFEETKKN
jgi:hypothetical protein